jgi:hypothetical protein
MQLEAAGTEPMPVGARPVQRTVGMGGFTSCERKSLVCGCLVRSTDGACFLEIRPCRIGFLFIFRFHNSPEIPNQPTKITASNQLHNVPTICFRRFLRLFWHHFSQLDYLWLAI